MTATRQRSGPSSAPLLFGALLISAITWALIGSGRSATPARAQGDPIMVDIVVRKAARLYGADLTLRYDPAQLSPMDALPSTPGIQAQVGSVWGASPFVVVNELDTTKSEMHLVVSLLAPAEPLAGDLILARMGFVPRRFPLEDAYDLQDVLLVDLGGQAIPLRWEGVVIDPLVDWRTVVPRLWLPLAAPGEREEYATGAVGP